MNRQPDHVGIRPFDSRDESRGQALNRVGTRLVLPLATCHVPSHVCLVQRHEIHRCRFDTPGFNREASKAHACQDLVPPARQPPQHPGGVALVLRLAKNLAVDDHRGVGSKNDRFVVSNGPAKAGHYVRTVGRHVASYVVCSFSRTSYVISGFSRTSYVVSGFSRTSYVVSGFSRTVKGG